METYFERVVETLTAAGYRWYETANFCRTPARGGRDLRARHNLGYWLGRDYLGLGVGAVSTIENRRWRNAPSLGATWRRSRAGERPPRELEELSPRRARTERVMLGLRLDEPLRSPGSSDALDAAGARSGSSGSGSWRCGRPARLVLTETRPFPRRRRDCRAPRVGGGGRSPVRSSRDFLP